MTAPTPEQRAEWEAFIADARRQAEYEAERFPGDDWPPVALALLHALESAEKRAINAEAALKWGASR